LEPQEYTEPSSNRAMENSLPAETRMTWLI